MCEIMSACVCLQAPYLSFSCTLTSLRSEGGHFQTTLHYSSLRTYNDVIIFESKQCLNGLVNTVLQIIQFGNSSRTHVPCVALLSSGGEPRGGRG